MDTDRIENAVKKTHPSHLAIILAFINFLLRLKGG